MEPNGRFLLDEREVGTAVNNVRNDNAALLEPA